MIKVSWEFFYKTLSTIINQIIANKKGWTLFVKFTIKLWCFFCIPLVELNVACLFVQDISSIHAFFNLNRPSDPFYFFDTALVFFSTFIKGYTSELHPIPLFSFILFFSSSFDHPEPEDVNKKECINFAEEV